MDELASGAGQRLYGVVAEGGVVRLVSIPVERETEKLIYFRHGGEVFPGRETVHKVRDRGVIFRSERAALESYVESLRGGLDRLAQQAERYENLIEAATRLADEADGEGFEGRAETRRQFTQVSVGDLRIGDLIARDDAGEYLRRVDSLEPGGAFVRIGYTPLNPQMAEGSPVGSDLRRADEKVLRLVGRRMKVAAASA